MTEIERQIIESSDNGKYSSETSVELLRLYELFSDYGEPTLTCQSQTGHLTWDIDGVSLTVSIGDSGLWGFCFLHLGGWSCVTIGEMSDSESVMAFRHLCLYAVAYLNKRMIERCP